MKLRDVGGQVHGLEDLLGDILGLDERDQAERGLALRAENLKPKNPAQKLGPPNISRGALGLVLLGRRCRRRRGWRHNLAAEAGVRCEYAKISDGMAAWRRNKGRESRDEGERRKFHRRGAIGPGLLEVQPDASVGQDVQPVVGEGWAQDIAAQGQPAGLVVGGDRGCSLQVETVGLRAQVALGDGTVVGAMMCVKK